MITFEDIEKFKDRVKNENFHYDILQIMLMNSVDKNFGDVKKYYNKLPSDDVLFFKHGENLSLNNMLNNEDLSEFRKYLN